MRTTLTIEPDVAARLEQLATKQQRPFKALVNEALRAGLDALERPTPRPVFRTRGFDLGTSIVGSVDNIEEVLSRAEGEHHK